MYNSCLPKQKHSINRTILANEIPNLRVSNTDTESYTEGYKPINIADYTPKPIKADVRSTSPSQEYNS